MTRPPTATCFAASYLGDPGGRRALRGVAPRVACLLLPLMIGCAPQRLRYGTVDETRRIVREILENARRVQCTLYGKPALVSFRFRDARGQDRRFIGHPAVLLFRPPRCLRIEVRSALGPVVARIGSNEERYWAWVDAGDLRKLWWGRWSALERGRARSFYIPPDDLLDVLLLRRLGSLADSADDRAARLGPLLEYRGREPWLIVQRLEPDAMPAVRRLIRLRERAPHLPVRILDFTSDGRLWMDAQLGAYTPVQEPQSSAWVARRYVIRWPQQRAELRLDLLRVRCRDLHVPFCTFPTRFRGEIEVLDEPAGGG